MLPVVLPICCGLDVHKKTVTACLLKISASGKSAKVKRDFGTTTPQLRQLADWLRQAGCQHVAMESTGVYWKPVHNILEGVCQEVLLVNAQHIKNVPGRKTDKVDAEWIATLLQHGLLRGSFIPPKEIRELRDLTRYRSTLVQQRAAECNRIQKLLENGNIKLASVATDVLGKSGQAMLQALVAGQDNPEVLADLARGRLRAKIPALIEALQGLLSDSQRWLLGEQLRRIADLDEAIARLDGKIAELTRPFEGALQMLDQVPGVNRRIAEIIIAEIGVDMTAFPSDGHLASWAGMCPGNNESGGKRRSGKTRKGCSWLRAALVEAAWAAGHCKHKKTYLAAQYQRIQRRRGKKRACVAVGHSILCIAYSLLARPRDYHDLGPDYFEHRDQESVKDSLVRRLRQLGYQVTLEKVPEKPAAA
jgi:transposase